MQKLPRSSPEVQGIASTAITDFTNALIKEKLELHSFMLVRHGHVLAEAWWAPYDASTVHLLYSLSKSFTALAVGIAIEEGLLSLDDTVLSFFPNKAPDAASEHLQAMQVRHLLSMSTGHLLDTLDRARQSADWVKGFLALPPDQAPGTIFCYNNGATFMLSAILHKLTNVDLLTYLKPRLLEPLGIEQAHWQENPEGIKLGFSGLHITTESIAKFGQLYLQKGNWQGQQLISEAWVHEASSKHIPTWPEGDLDWIQGYGFQFWMCQHGAYRADGAFGQFCVIMPEQNVVLAITSGVDNMQAVLDAAWTHLLPAMTPRALAPNRNAQLALKEKLDSLAYPPVKGKPISAIEGNISGKSYQFEIPKEADAFLTFESLSLQRLNNNHWQLSFEGNKTSTLLCGYNQWLVSTTSLYAWNKDPIVASGAWLNEHSFMAHIRYIESPHWLAMELTFREHELMLSMRWNVSFGHLESAAYLGHQLNR